MQPSQEGGWKRRDIGQDNGPSVNGKRRVLPGPFETAGAAICLQTRKCHPILSHPAAILDPMQATSLVEK